MKIVTITIALFLILLPLTAFPDITSQDITNAIQKKLVHPYLYFSEKDKPAILQRIKDDPELNDIMVKLTAEANRLLYMPVDTEVPSETKHPVLWGESKRENYAFEYTDHTYTLAFVYQMTGEKKYAQKAFEFLDCVCDIPSWTARYHQFPTIYTRVWPWNVPDDQVTFGYDIRVAIISEKISAAYDWLYPTLDKPKRDRIRGVLIEKAIIPVRGNYEYHWWATAYRCNWCTVCNSGLGCTALALLAEEPGLADVIAESYNRIGKTFDQLDDDGGWQEGNGYWEGIVLMSSIFMDPLKRLTNGKYNLFLHPKVAKNPVNFAIFNFIPPDKNVGFEDGGERVIGPTYELNKIAEETGSGEATWYRQHNWGAGTDIFDIIWPRSSVKPTLPEQPSHLFRGVGWAIMRSDFTDPEKVVVACKAGENSDPHHGHLDCGHFILYWRGKGFVSEIGNIVYDEQYFGDTRWTYPQVSSAGHNVVFVNGELQIIAKRKDKPWKENVGGKILTSNFSKNRDYTLMDPTGVYPGEQLKGWRRHIILEKPAITVIVDEIKSTKGAEIEVRFHSQAVQIVKDGYLLLESDNATMALIPVTENSFQFRPGKHAILPHRIKASFSWFPYCGVIVNTKDANTVIGQIILPVKNDNEAQHIAQSKVGEFDSSGNYSLSFVKEGITYTFTFNKGKDGLELTGKY